MSRLTWGIIRTSSLNICMPISRLTLTTLVLHVLKVCITRPTLTRGPMSIPRINTSISHLVTLTLVLRILRARTTRPTSRLTRGFIRTPSLRICTPISRLTSTPLVLQIPKVCITRPMLTLGPMSVPRIHTPISRLVTLNLVLRILGARTTRPTLRLTQGFIRTPRISTPANRLTLTPVLRRACITQSLVHQILRAWMTWCMPRAHMFRLILTRGPTRIPAISPPIILTSPMTIQALDNLYRSRRQLTTDLLMDYITITVPVKPTITLPNPKCPMNDLTHWLSHLTGCTVHLMCIMSVTELRGNLQWI